MKLINHVLDIRKLVQQAMDNRFSKMGIKESELTPIDALPEDLRPKRQKLEDILNNHQSELEDYAKARQETINECTFTLFNRIAAIKVMEEKELFPEVIKRRPENGNKSFSHNLWLEENPSEKNAERQGLKHFLQSKFNDLGETFPLYNENYPYSLMPTADELFNILEAFNAVEGDPDCGVDIWKGDDILGWLYEYFNAVEKEVLKDSGEKTEYDKVSLQSQVYTPRWVVKFLVDNTLGKFYLEMFPDSDLVKPDSNGEVKYKIANAPSSRKREPKKMEEIRVIDPACGSGNFLIYTFDLLYDMYLNQVEQYGADYSRRDIPRLILENNIYGVDLDERAVQLSQIALFIKSRELGGRRVKMASHTNVVSTRFFLPNYSAVESEFIASGEWDQAQRDTIKKIWSDLQNAHKFGSLVRVEEVLNGLSLKDDEGSLFASEMEQDLFSFKRRVTDVLHDQVKAYCEKNASSYALTKAEDAMTFLGILSMPFDVVVANPPYTDSSNFGVALKEFVDTNYKAQYKFNYNLYSCFINRCCELADEQGLVGMISPLSFMYIVSYEGVRKYILNNFNLSLLAELGLGGVFQSAQVDVAAYIIKKDRRLFENTSFISLIQYKGLTQKYPIFRKAYEDLVNGVNNPHNYSLEQDELKKIKSWPFIYWISDDFRKKFSGEDLDSVMDIKQGIATADNNRFLRYWWEVAYDTISKEKGDSRKWVKYSKGGPYCKWYGNLWAVINWGNDGYEIKHFADSSGKIRSAVRNQEYYLRDAITYTSSGSKGATFRYLPENYLFDSGGSCIFTNRYDNLFYTTAFLNSILSFYICDCLNPTVNTTQGDLWRIPFIKPDVKTESIVTNLSKQNIDIKRHICEYSIIEYNFKESPIVPSKDPQESLLCYYNRENLLNTIVLLNEAVINEQIMSVYQLTDEDRQKVISKQGAPIGGYPVSVRARDAFIKAVSEDSSFKLEPITHSFIENLPIKESSIQIDDFDSLYQANNDWESFCISHASNPIDVWYSFRQNAVLPSQRTRDLAFELIVDCMRSVLNKDDDGVIPLVEKAGEEQASRRLELELNNRGYSLGTISNVFRLLGKNIDEYLSSEFFSKLVSYFNLFRHFPSSPFIWHITSGPLHALDLFIIIYKWDRNSLFRIKSVYCANRESSLKDKLATLDDSDVSSQIEIKKLKEQLLEMRSFIDRIDLLLSSDYNPSLDSGVAKNIAPIQANDLLACEVLNSSQLKKYLNADW